MSGDKRNTQKSADRFKRKSWPIIARITLLVVASLFIAWGIFIDEPFTVLNKAIFICLECIGVG